MFYDEHIDAQGCIRSHYQPVQEWFDRLTPAHLSALEQQRNESFRRQGITFTVYGNSEGTERTWPMDLYPQIIDATEWATIERGLCQRVTALNHFLDDIYSGTQAIIADGIIPQRLITSCTGFEREAMNVSVPLGARCVVAGIDLVRGADGGYQVLEDNLRNPSGISYVIENRAAMTKLMPAAFANLAVRSVNHYGRSLLRALRSIAPPACGDDPTIVVLTPGVFNSAYFEHAFLARSMGVELVEGRDLVVDNHVVAMRTTRGLERVDVIYRRIDDAFLDPVVFNPHSTLGVPGLMAAARAGTVTLANSVGNGVGDDKAVYAYVPNMIRYYLNEQPIIPNATTYLLWEHDQRTEVLNRLDELVIKPVAESGGYGIVIGPKASDAELHTARQNILKDPRNWIAQEVVNLSRLPAWDGDEFAPRHIDLRPFVLCGEQTEVIPGGLTRVAMRPGSLIVNSSQGGGSKDTWVLGTNQPNQPATAPEASPATTPAASPATAPEASPATPANSPSGPANRLS
ncbi:MAG: circularly permuted type 2 ATP-grasp protein [bacterium]|nr:circularly permuted type 2 ATP-grasp protein [bacterium]